jgi:hypothetical protein
MIGFAFYVSCLNFCERTSFSPEKTVRHYCGNGGNPNDEDILKEGISFPKTYRELIEITHVHAFTIPLIIFVMSRIFSMTSIREWIKTTVYTSAFAGTLINLSGPWLVGNQSIVFAVSLMASYLILGLCFLLLISLPIYEMWFKKKITI